LSVRDRAGCRPRRFLDHPSWSDPVKMQRSRMRGLLRFGALVKSMPRTSMCEAMKKLAGLTPVVVSGAVAATCARGKQRRRCLALKAPFPPIRPAQSASRSSCFPLGVVLHRTSPAAGLDVVNIAEKQMFGFDCPTPLRETPGSQAREGDSRLQPTTRLQSANGPLASKDYASLAVEDTQPVRLWRQSETRSNDDCG
jgi:hypothetical protein